MKAGGEVRPWNQCSPKLEKLHKTLKPFSSLDILPRRVDDRGGDTAALYHPLENELHSDEYHNFISSLYD